MPPELPKKPYYNLKPLLVFIFFITLGYFLGNFYPFSIYSKSWISTKTTPKAECRACSQAPANVTYEQPKGEFKTYTSDKLGIALSYYEYGSGDRVKDAVKVQEIDDKVYLYSNSSKTAPDDPTKGKYLQMTAKDPSSSLADAVKEFYLQDKSNCTVSEYPTIGSLLNPTYEYIKIDTNPSCTSSLTQAHGINYFVMDTAHPDKFALIVLGQDNFAFPVTSRDSTPITWDFTINFY